MPSWVRGPELIIILFLAILLFGRGRIGSIFKELGKGLKDFRDGIRGEDTDIQDNEHNEDSSSQEPKN